MEESNDRLKKKTKKKQNTHKRKLLEEKDDEFAGHIPGMRLNSSISAMAIERNDPNCDSS
jgi:hypothetical protein